MSDSLCRVWLFLLLPLYGLPEADSSDNTEKEQFEALMSWMQVGINQHVPAEYLEGLPILSEVLTIKGRTILAKRDLREGELLMRFPEKRLMHAGHFLGEGAPIAAKMKEALESKIVYVAPQTWLAVYMMEQRHLGRASDWYPYLSFLPSEFPGNPIYYGQEEYKWLEGSTFVQRAQTHMQSLQGQYDTVADLVPDFAKNFTKQEFLWARSAIATRVFGWDLPFTPKDHRDFMVPLGDMLNHRSPKQVEWIYNSTTDTLDYWMKENVTVGDELLISYGTKSNAEYMLHYGFAVAGLPQRNYTVCSVKVAMGLEDVPAQEAKRKWLVKASFTPVKDHESVQFNLRNEWAAESSRMLAHARLLMLPDMQAVERYTKDNKKTCIRIAQPPNCPQPVSIENERAALERCLRTVEEALAKYPTTLEEDEKLLQTLEGLPASLVTLRRDEKFVLWWWKDYFSLALESFSKPSMMVRKCADMLGSSKCSVEENPYMFKTLADLVGGLEDSSWQWQTWLLGAMGVSVAVIIMLFFVCAGNRTCTERGNTDGTAAGSRSASRKGAAAKANSGSHLRKRQGQR